MLWNKFPVEYEPDYGARIGLVPRKGRRDTIWFDCEPGVILHSVNAYETQDGKVVVHGLRSEPKQSSSFLSQYATTFLHEWTLDLESGSCEEKCLNPHALVEFPVINDSFHGLQVDSVYCASVGSIGGPLKVNTQPEQGILLDGIKKLALTDNENVQKGDVVGQYILPEDWHSVSEPTVVPKTNKSGEYVLLLATYVPKGTSWQSQDDLKALKSQILLLDGDRLEMGPVWTADLPYHVPYGLHSSFVKWGTLQ
jgi:carotenoid cleavage dioxygenase